MQFKRDLYKQLEKDLHNDQVIVITGMRRVGKTTTLNYLFDQIQSTNKAYFDFEDPLIRKLFELEDYEAILSGLKDYGINHTERAYLFLDEIQNHPPVTSIMKYLHDHHQTKFFVTGSSSYYLKNLFPESLAGRKFTYELHPLTFSEFLSFKGIAKESSSSFSDKSKSKNIYQHTKMLPLYEEYIKYGGFPQVVLTNTNIEKKQILNDIFKSYFENDVKKLSDFQELGKVRDLILLLTARVGANIETSKLASELTISRDTLYSYLTFLESTYFITLIPKHTNSIDRQTAGNKKVYFCDTGLISAIGTPSVGQALEQSIFQNLHPVHSLSYYRTSKNEEIDFVVDKTTALEVKKHVVPQDIGNLKKRMLSAKLEEGYVITQDYSELNPTILATDL